MTKVVLPPHLDAGATALRPWRENDIAALVTLCADPEISRWTRAPSPYRETDARAFLLHRYDLLAAGVAASWAIVDAEDGSRLLGSVSLTRIERDAGRAEVGYWLGAAARGHGHATRAVEALVCWGAGALGLERFTLLAATGNAASQRVAERAGFAREAVLRSYASSSQGRRDMIAFGRLITLAPRR